MWFKCQQHQFSYCGIKGPHEPLPGSSCIIFLTSTCHAVCSWMCDSTPLCLCPVWNTLTPSPSCLTDYYLSWLLSTISKYLMVVTLWGSGLTKENKRSQRAFLGRVYEKIIVATWYSTWHALHVSKVWIQTWYRQRHINKSFIRMLLFYLNGYLFIIMKIHLVKMGRRGLCS